MKYGFKKHLSPIFPSQIIVDLTQLCNLACIHCPHPIFVKSTHFIGVHLDVSLHNKMIDEVSRESNALCQYIRYTANGETLLHPQFEEIIAYAGEYSKTKINITTNGHLLDENKIKAILNAKVDVIDISLDAFTSETYAKIRIHGNLEKVRNNILHALSIIKEKKLTTKVIVSFVEQPQNVHEKQKFYDYWTEAGAHFVVMRELHSSAGFKAQISKKMQQNSDAEQKLRRPCIYPWERLTLAPDGMLAFCPADWKGGSHFIDFRTTTIKEAWQSEFMQKLREAHLENNYKDFPLCEKCPDWVNTKWEDDEGIMYHDVMKSLMVDDTSKKG